MSIEASVFTMPADAFGKEIYKTNGSHGCVNTPYEAVKTLFEIVKTGTPVVVY